ncbi:MAG: mevalonate kinase, partial [Chloroflexi bacterium]|nr:mevalonate kinase [Chloroflexota bacterium]
CGPVGVLHLLIMPSFSATAPGKIILFGEHAVVYGEPAIAVPVLSLQARALVSAQVNGKSGQIWIEAPDISLSAPYIDLNDNHPLREAINAVLGDRDPAHTPACKIQIFSTIPRASGLGSSAAISAATIRAFSAFLGKRLTDKEVSDLTYIVEIIHHGTPSGIDNTVVAHQKPVYYQKGDPLQLLSIGEPFSILIVDTGIPGKTREAVAGVREKWLDDPDSLNQIFSDIGLISKSAKDLIESGSTEQLGPLMNQNHLLLQKLGVSTPRLDQLVQIARDHGALGAKLSGGGLGGHLIALVERDSETIAENLILAGASSAMITSVKNRDVAS